MKIIVPVVIFLALVSCTSENGANRPTPSPQQSLFCDLDAGAGSSGGRIEIRNKSSEVWTNIKIEVNGVYVFVADAIPPGETYRYMASLFTKSDGTRLNPISTAVQRIDIHATTPRGRCDWNGVMR